MTPPDHEQRQAQTSGTESHVTFLVEKARAGSTAAFEQLVDLFQEKIFRMIYYRTRSRMDAEDLMQEIFIKAFKNLPQLRKSEMFKGWLFSIAVNRVRDFQRKKRVLSLFGTLGEADEFDQPDASTSDNPDALNHLIRQDFWRQVSLLLDKLSRLEREVFLLRFMDHLGIAEIAQALNRSESTVKTHLYRALKKFKEEQALHKLLEVEAS
ncbi:MAG: RNA polymerase sigma factor [Syntrophobacterales bacterium]|jgi:RNA polymerase sigma-70 factor (ECF subfamily)